MTAVEIDTMKAGTELDYAVGIACGLPCLKLGVDCGDGNAIAPNCYLGMGRPFCPSTDWNDAMFAAEMFGMCETYCRAISKDANGWYVYCFDCEPDAPIEDLHVVAAPTGPLAICRAILKINESVDL